MKNSSTGERFGRLKEQKKSNISFEEWMDAVKELDKQEENPNVFTARELAAKMGLSLPSLRTRILPRLLKQGAVKPAGTKRVARSDGQFARVPAYELAIPDPKVQHVGVALPPDGGGRTAIGRPLREKGKKISANED